MPLKIHIEGERLRQWRERRLITRGELADQTGISYSTIQSVEIGRRTPTISTLRKLCEALGITPSDIEEGSSNKRRVKRSQVA